MGLALSTLPGKRQAGRPSGRLGLRTILALSGSVVGLADIAVQGADTTQRARREVEWASVWDYYDDPHRRSLTGGAHPSSRLARTRHTQSCR
jgi:hypothetical protein